MSAPSALPFALIALDLDGTLTNSEKAITTATMNALMRAQKNGLRLILASGRPTKGIAPLAEQLRLADHGGYVLSYNGGRIIDWTSKATIYRQTVDQELVPLLYRYAEQATLPIVTYLQHSILASRKGNKYLDEESRINAMPVEEVPNFLEEVSMIEGGATKFLIPGAPEQLIPLEKEMSVALQGRMEVFRSAPYFLELTAKGIDKAQSLHRLLVHLGNSPEQLIAFGDGYNDLTMIKFAGMGIAMGNAANEVKKEANYVTASNDEDGIAKALAHFHVVD